MKSVKELFFIIFPVGLLITHRKSLRQWVGLCVTIQFIEINHAQSYNHSTNS